MKSYTWEKLQYVFFFLIHFLQIVWVFYHSSCVEFFYCDFIHLFAKKWAVRFYFSLFSTLSLWKFLHFVPKNFQRISYTSFRCKLIFFIFFISTYVYAENNDSLSPSQCNEISVERRVKRNGKKKTMYDFPFGDYMRRVCWRVSDTRSDIKCKLFRHLHMLVSQTCTTL